MFTLDDMRYRIDHHKLIAAREKLNITQAAFARACGWSQQYQWKLENDYVDTVTESTMNIILDTLNRLGLSS